MSARSQSVRSCSASGISSPSASVRAGRRASISSISASRPITSPSSGSSAPHHPRQPDRLVRQLGPEQRAPRAARVPLVEDEVEDVEDAPPAGLLLLAGRHPERHRRRLDPLLGPRDPLRHRRLVDHERACDLGRRQPADRAQRQGDRRGRRQRRVAAHEQHRQRVVLVGAPPGRAAPAGRRPSPCPRGSCSLRHWSISRRSAVWISQPRAPAGMPSRGQCTDAASSASWTASSAASKSPYLRASTPRTCGASSRSRASTSAALVSARLRAHSSRTWIGCSSATPSGPGTAEYLAAISIARSSDSTSTIM